MAPERAPTLFDFADMSDQNFLDQAEDGILVALKEYAERAENGRVVRRRLFTQDAARGFAFIDLCRKRYDVVLMNPPFGEFSAKTKSSVASFYGPAKNDIYGAFMTRALELLHSHSRFGAITSRTWLALSSFRKLREFLLLHSRPQIIADLGRDVLDDANVQVCAYAVEKP
jgi:23S rRNA G2069 N7-methylase RlmK/C1962 C5-methylase RlmI